MVTLASACSIVTLSSPRQTFPRERLPVSGSTSDRGESASMMGMAARLGREVRALVTAVRDGLAEHADPATAEEQQRYMKSAMPYRGLKTPLLRSVVRPLIAEHLLPDRGQWEAAVRTLWDEAAYREERYAALSIAGDRRYRGHQDPDTIDLYDHLVVTGAWWDLVDAIAIQLIGPIQRRYRPVVNARMRAWAADHDLWRRRAAILHQVGAEDATDRELLVDCILPNLTDREFFIRKAIGWALRQYARLQPDWVAGFVAEHEDRMSGLSRREATKHLA